MIMHKNIRAAVQNIKDGPRVLKQENLGSKTEKGPIRKDLYTTGGYIHETIKLRGFSAEQHSATWGVDWDPVMI
jgi:hypothetical protein